MKNAELERDTMSGNISVDKSFELAIRIVNLYKYLSQEKK